MLKLLYNLFKMFDDTTPKGAIDMPDNRDYYAEHVLGADDGNYPEKIKWMTKADNQGNTVKCTTYSAYHVGRILNELEHDKTLEGKPDLGWTLQQKFGTHTKNGDLVQTALKSIVKSGCHCLDKPYAIDSYARIKDHNLKMWLARGFPVVTSNFVTKTNYKKAKYEGLWGGLDGPIVGGHAIAIIGYEPGYYWVLNSYGDNWGFYKDGTFKVKESDIKHLGSMYILYDSEDAKQIFRDVTSKSPFAEDIEWALDEGIMLGYESESLPAEKRFFKPEASVSRAELAAIMHRFKSKFY